MLVGVVVEGDVGGVEPAADALLEAGALELAQGLEGVVVFAACGGSIAEEERGAGLGVFGGEEGEDLAAFVGEVVVFGVDVFALAKHFEFEKRGFHGEDALLAPVGGD